MKAITPGAEFSTPYESGCIVVTAPDDLGSFEAYDSDAVLCSFSVAMVTSIKGACCADFRADLPPCCGEGS